VIAHDREAASEIDASPFSLEAKRVRRACTIYCFAIAGPQFLARFDEEPAAPLWGRTFIQAEVIPFAASWVEAQDAE
jgi:hypothetical protein